MSSTSPKSLFRPEALEHHNRGEVKGSLLKFTPTWVRATYWLVVVLALVGSIGLALVDVNEYAQGPVLIQEKGVEDVTSTAAGRVGRVLVHRGQRVTAGEPLVDLYAGGEHAERERVAQEMRAQLAARLLDPLNANTGGTLGGLRAQLELSDAMVSERTLKAPFDGWVRDVRVRENQYLEAGQVVVTLGRDDAEAYALALVPGQYRPLLQPGQRMRLELNGFAFLYQDVQVSAVSDELVGPNEVKRYLGAGHGDMLTVEGPMVVVEARLPRESFKAHGYAYRYYSGMLGTGQIRVRQRNGWSVLIPALDLLWGDRG